MLSSPVIVYRTGVSLSLRNRKIFKVHLQIRENKDFDEWIRSRQMWNKWIRIYCNLTASIKILNSIIYTDIRIKFIDFRIAAIIKCILLLSYHSWIEILSFVFYKRQIPNRRIHYYLFDVGLFCVSFSTCTTISVSLRLPGNSAQLRGIAIVEEQRWW